MARLLDVRKQFQNYLKIGEPKPLMFAYACVNMIKNPEHKLWWFYRVFQNICTRKNSNRFTTINYFGKIAHYIL